MFRPIFLQSMVILAVVGLAACAPPREPAKIQIAVMRDSLNARQSNEREALRNLVAGWLEARKALALATWQGQIASTRSQVLIALMDKADALHTRIGGDLRQTINGDLAAIDAQIAAASQRSAAGDPAAARQIRDQKGVKAAIMITAQRTYDEACDHVDQRLKTLRTSLLADLDRLESRPPEVFTTFDSDGEARKLLGELGPDAQLQGLAQGLEALHRYLDAPDGFTLATQGLIPDNQLWASLRNRLSERITQFASQMQTDTQARLGELHTTFTNSLGAVTLTHP